MQFLPHTEASRAIRAHVRVEGLGKAELRSAGDERDGGKV